MFSPHPNAEPVAMQHFSTIPDPFSQPIRRSNSLTWKADAGLPPPPSEIDRYPDIHRHMQPTRVADAYDQISSADAMPTHAVTKHPKLKLRILLTSGIFQAGDAISGVLEITSSTSQRLRLGEIAVELEAFEELSSRDHAATQIFLYNRTLFQGEHLPPSNAVLPSAPLQGHWTARKGRTTFPFSFHLPASAPSSVSFAGNANLRYSIKGTAQTWWNEARSLVTVRSDAFVVERWHDELDPRYLEPVEAIADTHIFMGGSGAVWLEASTAERLFVAGSLLVIRAGVKNNSKRHLSGLKVCIVRRLVFPTSGPPGKPAHKPNLEPQITEVIHSQSFKGPSFEFPPSEEVVVNLAVDLPNEVRSIRKTRLFEVHMMAIVSAQMGNFAKDLSVEIPLYVAHPNSLQHRPSTRAIEPLHNLPQRARSAMSQHGQHRDQPSPMPMQSPFMLQHPAPSESPLTFKPDNFDLAQYEAYAIQRGWSPAAVQAPLPRPASAAAYFPTAVQNNPLNPQRRADGHMQASIDTPAAWHVPHGSAVLPPMPTPQQIPRSYSAAPAVPHGSGEVLHLIPTSPQPQQQTQQQVSEPEPSQAGQKGPLRRYSDSAIPKKTEVVEICHAQLNIPQVPSPSQLLGPDGVPVGLATIQEDSESAAGTVRSMRTLIGSVTRGDIAQFEEMVKAADDEVEARNAMLARGMMPESSGRPDPVQNKGSDDILSKKTLPSAPKADKESTKKDHGSRSSQRPRASDLFNGPKTNEQKSPKADRNAAQDPDKILVTIPVSPPSLPSRPASVQGVGLTALESRLKTASQNKVVSLPQRARKSEPTPGKVVTMANVSARSTDRPDGKNADCVVQKSESISAVEQEKRQRREDVARLMKETKKESQASRRVVAQPSPTVAMKAAAAQGGKTSNPPKDSVDVDEMRKLTKEAVGRVNGWLSSSPNSSRTSTDSQGVADPALSPKTPSPSVLRDDVLVEDGHPNSVRMLKYDDDAADLKLSAELRALVDGTEGLAKPLRGTSISSHPSSRRFSATSALKADAKVKETAAIRSVLRNKSNEQIHIPKKFEETLKRPSKDEYPSELGSDDQETGSRYDVRSARGGRGGRVASVACMWTSIAEGTDGSQGKSNAPVLTLKPKAIRSGSQVKLDFGKMAEKPKKISLPPLIVDNKVKAPESKATGAPFFVNTTMPRPVFASAPSPGNKPAEESADVHPPPPTRQLMVKGAHEVVVKGKEGRLNNSRKITSDLIAAEARLGAGRDLKLDQLPTVEQPMNGRGTTKPIGRDRLADLRSLWGG